jgi:hypothetical protein
MVVFAAIAPAPWIYIAAIVLVILGVGGRIEAAILEREAKASDSEITPSNDY